MALDLTKSISVNALAWSLALEALVDAQNLEDAALVSLAARVSALETATPTPGPAPTPTPAPSPAISFDAATATIVEGNSGTKTITSTLNLVRDGLTGDRAVDLSYSGTAEAGSDYVAGPSSVTIPAGQSSVSVVLTINGDITVEPDETIVITATLVGYSGVTSTKTITVTNDDVAATPAPGAPTLARASGDTGNPPAFTRTFGANTLAEDDDWVERNWADNNSFTGSKLARLLIDTKLITDGVDGNAGADWSQAVGDTWPASFAAESTGYFRERVVRNPTSAHPIVGEWSNTVPVAFQAAEVSYAHLYSEKANYGYGSDAPALRGPIAIQNGDKIYVSFAGVFNGAQSITGVTANNDTITFTKIETKGDGGSEPYGHFYADTAGVTSLTDIKIKVSGSTNFIGMSVFAIRNAKSGGPSASALQSIAVTNNSPITVNAGLRASAGSKMLIALQAGNGGIFPTGGTLLFQETHSSTYSAVVQTPAQAADVTITGQAAGGPNYCNVVVGVTKWSA